MNGERGTRESPSLFLDIFISHTIVNNSENFRTFVASLLHGISFLKVQYIKVIF